MFTKVNYIIALNHDLRDLKNIIGALVYFGEHRALDDVLKTLKSWLSAII